MRKNSPSWRKALPRPLPGKGNIRLYGKWDAGGGMDAELVFDYIELPKELVLEIISKARAMVSRERVRQSSQWISDGGKPIVHALWQGVSLCKMSGLPSEWPVGHQWVNANDSDMKKEINCADCLSVMSKNQESVDSGT